MHVDCLQGLTAGPHVTLRVSHAQHTERTSSANAAVEEVDYPDSINFPVASGGSTDLVSSSHALRIIYVLQGNAMK